MLLRIIDRVNEHSESDCVELKLEQEGELLNTFTVEYYSSPLTKNTQQLLAWYFANYLSEYLAKTGDRDASNKIIKIAITWVMNSWARILNWSSYQNN